MLKIACHELYAHPLPEGHRFPMLKYELIPAQLLHEGIIAPEDLFVPEILQEPEVLRAHLAGYWTQLRDLTLPAREQRRIGFPLTARLLERELRIAKGTIDSAGYARQCGLSFNVAGGTHHAGAGFGEGFCLLNDQAIAAMHLIANRIYDRILIIDLDVHQGNGTAEIFSSQPQVFTFSMHCQNNFPFRKAVSDLDIGLDEGTTDQQYLDILTATLPRLFHACRPQFVFYLAGVDVLGTDKLGKLALTKAGCLERDRIVFNFCRKYALPVQVSMGGGYSAEIRDIVDAHCHTFKAGIDILLG